MDASHAMSLRTKEESVGQGTENLLIFGSGGVCGTYRACVCAWYLSCVCVVHIVCVRGTYRVYMRGTYRVCAVTSSR